MRVRTPGHSSQNPPSLPGDDLVGQARWLGEEGAVTAAGEGESDSRVDADVVAGGDEEWLVTGPGADRGADDLAAVDQGRVSAEDTFRFLVVADEAALGAADGWTVEDDSQVRRQAETAGMGVALA